MSNLNYPSYPKALYKVRFYGKGLIDHSGQAKTIGYNGTIKNVIARDAEDAILKLRSSMISVELVYSVEFLDYIDIEI